MGGKYFKTLLWIVLLLLWYVGPVSAAVKGPCSNCHTMHNSQDNSVVSGSSNDTLLVSNCVGCHSSTGADTIVNLGSARVPIVYNTGGYPAQPLAGGNFYYVADAGGNLDNRGHNVYGISGQDGALSHAPLDGNGTSYGCNNTCHATLALPKSSMAHSNFEGCQICHQKFKHHGTDIADGAMETADSGWYRFLGGHDAASGAPDVFATAYVKGVEDGDWEQNPATGHNGYFEVLKASNAWTMLYNTQSMSSFCLGCHTLAHLSTQDANNNWLRHPTMIRLPTTGEFAAYDPAASYDATVPVGWLNPVTPVRADAVVMCLSCHRAHGSPNPDMLRWDYTKMVANAGDSNEGCFKCHSTKDT